MSFRGILHDDLVVPTPSLIVVHHDCQSSSALQDIETALGTWISTTLNTTLTSTNQYTSPGDTQ